MHIDIATIDKYIINKNKQFHQFDETAYAFYLIAFWVTPNKKGLSSNGYLSRIHCVYFIIFREIFQ